MSLSEYEQDLLDRILFVLAEVRDELREANKPVMALASDKPPPFPRRCIVAGHYGNGPAVCHGFFNGTKYLDMERPVVSSPVAVIEQGGNIAVVIAEWVTFPND